jgi:hypothetical protein
MSPQTTLTARPAGPVQVDPETSFLPGLAEVSRQASSRAIYASAYYPHVAAFPGYLSAAIETAVDAEVRAEPSATCRTNYPIRKPTRNFGSTLPKAWVWTGRKSSTPTGCPR